MKKSIKRKTVQITRLYKHTPCIATRCHSNSLSTSKKIPVIQMYKYNIIMGTIKTLNNTEWFYPYWFIIRYILSFTQDKEEDTVTWSHKLSSIWQQRHPTSKWNTKFGPTPTGSQGSKQSRYTIMELHYILFYPIT